MNILEALHKEESKLQRRLTAIQGAITALNDGRTTIVSSRQTNGPNGKRGKRTMSLAVRTKIARAARARWAKIRAEKAKKAK
jgi:hypothetical protein